MVDFEEKKNTMIRDEAFKSMISDSIIIYEDYDLFSDINPDQFMKFNDMMINLYKKKGLLDYYLRDLDDYLDSFYFLALFEDNLDCIDFNYFVNKMIFLINNYGFSEVVGYDFSSEKNELLNSVDSNIINIETYKQYKKIVNEYQ